LNCELWHIGSRNSTIEENCDAGMSWFDDAGRSQVSYMERSTRHISTGIMSRNHKQINPDLSPELHHPECMGWTATADVCRKRGSRQSICACRTIGCSPYMTSPSNWLGAVGRSPKHVAETILGRRYRCTRTIEYAETGRAWACLAFVNGRCWRSDLGA
jgi:hypothetical protein